MIRKMRFNQASFMLFGFRVPIMVMMKVTSIHESLPSGFDICYIYYTDDNYFKVILIFFFRGHYIKKSININLSLTV